MSHSVSCGNRRFTLQALTRRTSAQAVLDAGAADLRKLFLEREREFGFNPAVVVEYPDVATPERSLFLRDPIAMIQAHCMALARLGRDVSKVVVLTSFADRLAAPFAYAGYEAQAIDMPAGPAHTSVFTRWLPEVGDGAGTFYVEAMNEADEQTRCAFVLRLFDEQGVLAGGACGSLRDRSGRRYAHVATMAVRAGLPPSTGTRLAGALRAFLRSQGVATVHLATQTADGFCEKAGFKVTHRLIPALRTRYAADDRLAAHDLVMMAMDL